MLSIRCHKNQINEKEIIACRLIYHYPTLYSVYSILLKEQFAQHETFAIIYSYFSPIERHAEIFETYSSHSFHLMSTPKYDLSYFVGQNRLRIAECPSCSFSYRVCECNHSGQERFSTNNNFNFYLFLTQWLQKTRIKALETLQEYTHCLE